MQIPETHPAFAGHFPGRPIVPGAWLLAVAVQAAACVLGADASKGRVAQAKFLKPLGPGTPYQIDVTVTGPASAGIRVLVHDEPALTASVQFGADRS